MIGSAAMRQAVIHRGTARPTSSRCGRAPDPLPATGDCASASAPPASTSPTSSPGSGSIPTRRSRRWSSATRSPATSTPSARGVTGFADGDRVVALTRFGGYSDTVVVPAAQAFRFPDELSDAEAAAVPVNYLTAALALYRMAALTPGETVLIHNAGGGVGIAATQLARLRRATVIGTASAFKHDALRSFGVEHAIDYRHADVAEEVRAITRGRGVDVILDPIGGRSFTVELSHARAARPADRLRPVGGGASASGATSGARSGRGCRRRASIRCRSSTATAACSACTSATCGTSGVSSRRSWRCSSSELRAGRLTPVVARTFPARARRRRPPLHPEPVEHRQSGADDVTNVLLRRRPASIIGTSCTAPSLSAPPCSGSS